MKKFAVGRGAAAASTPPDSQLILEGRTVGVWAELREAPPPYLPIHLKAAKFSRRLVSLHRSNVSEKDSFTLCGVQRSEHGHFINQAAFMFLYFACSTLNGH